MGTIFDISAKRTNTSCIKWDFRKEDFGNGDVLPFSIADADYPTCPAVIQAIADRIKDNSVLGYTDLDKCYKHAVCQWFVQRHGWEISEEWITSAAGIIPAISAAIAALTSENAAIVIQPPVYDPFFAVIRANGRRILENPLLRDEKGAYTIDFDDLEEKLAQAEMLLLCSPHNPVGRVWSEEELAHVVDLCRRYHVILISDEIHWDILLAGNRHVSVGALTNEKDRVMVCTAPSKTFNMAGLQTSNIVISNEEMRKTYQNWLFSRYMFCANTLGLIACREAYTHGREWVDAQNIYLTESARMAKNYFMEHIPEATVTDLQGTFLMWMDFTYLHCSGDLLVKKIAEHGAGVNCGSHYGADYDGFLRMNIACPHRQLEAGLDSIRKAVAEIKGGREK